MKLSKKFRGSNKRIRTSKAGKFLQLEEYLCYTYENGGFPWSLISQLMGYKDDNMILDVYSVGLVIKPFRESIGKLSCGEEIDNHLIRDIIG